MPNDVFTIFVLLGMTLVIGYVGTLFFERTKIPDISWLILFGLLIGPVLNLVEREPLLDIAPVLGSFALLLILFEAGLNIDFFQVVRGFSRSIFLAFVSTALTMMAVFLISMMLFDFGISTSLLLGAILGGTSSPVVLSMIGRVNLREKVKTLLKLESIFTDPLVIIISIALLQYMSRASGSSPLQGILSAFSTGAVLGGFMGILWIFVLDKLKDRPYDYMLTLATLFLIFALAEKYGGSGAIATLSFGIVLGNSAKFSKMLKFEKEFRINRLFKVFQSELSFFIRSFFFVFLGIVFPAKPIYILYGLIISGVIILVRLLAAELSTYKMELGHKEMNFVRVMVPRGLAAAVLAQLPVQEVYAQHFKPEAIEIFSSVTLVVIIATIIYSIIMTRILSSETDF